MALKNSISITITEDNVKNIKDRLDVILTEHPFISIPLPALNNKHVIGPKREPIVERMLEVAKLHSSEVPAKISLVEIERDYKETYIPIRTLIGYYQQHISKLEMLSHAAGSDAMEAIDEIRRVFNAIAVKDKELQDAMAEVNKFYKQQSTVKDPDPTVPPPTN